MPSFRYTVHNVKLPSNKFAVIMYQAISVIGGIIILCTAVIILLAIFSNISLFADIFGKKIVNMPTVIAFTSCGAVIYFYEKKKLFHKWGIDQTSLFIFFGFLVFFIGLLTGIAHVLPKVSLLQYISVVDVKSGFIFSLVGLSLLITFSRMPHKFHYSQLFLLAALAISLLGFLQNMYQFVTIDKFIFNEKHSFLGSWLLLVLAQSFMFARPDRGFIGLFTTDTNSSQLARRSIFYFAMLPPILGFYILAGESIGISDAYGRLALLVVAVIIMAIGITWLNIKLLYNSEVERYVMRETLRENNISLEMHAKDLSTKVGEMEKAKKRIADKLNHQQTLADLIESYG